MAEIPILNKINSENELYQINGHNTYYNNEKINENDKKNVDDIYINKNNNNTEENENINMNNTNSNLNDSIKINNQNDSNKRKLMSSIEWINYIKQSKINLEEINKVLLSNVESIDNENIKLKEALLELIKDLKEKENSLDESLKIISKLKNNYSILFYQYQSIEKKYSKLNEENESLKKENDISNKNILETVNRKNDLLKDEINKIKKENQILKNNNIIKTNECIKFNKEMNEIKIIMEDLKKRNLEYLNMIKDRENLIIQYNSKIKELNDEINNKNEQIKLLVKFSKNINDGNKSNVQELTKQACKTIQLLYNNNKNNNNSGIINNENNNLNKIIKIIFNNENLDNNNSKEENNTNNINDNLKITFKLKEAIQDNLLIDDNNNVMNINHEFIMNIIIKFNLLKIELFSSFLREFYFIIFLNSLINKINVNNTKDFNLIEKTNKIIIIKIKNENLKKKNKELINKLLIFKNKIKELNLFIVKLKKRIELIKIKMKEKIDIILNLYNKKINDFNEQINKIKNNYLNEIELYKLKLNNIDNNDNNDSINKDNYNIKINNQFKKEKEKENYFKFLKYENIISFNINNFNSNNKNSKINSNKNFDFSQINNNKNIIIPNNNNSNNLSFQQKEPINKKYNNNNESFNEKNYQQKKIENEKLKEEITHLKNEIKELLKDINKQQKLISESNTQTKNNNKINNICEKCEFINSLMIRLNIPDSYKLIEIKNIILSSPSFDENIKNIINNIFDIITKLLTINNIENYTINNSNINDSYKYNLDNDNLDNKLNLSFFNEINIKIFSSSELKKYYSIYDEKIKNINELIDIYIMRVNDIKNNINGLKFAYESTVSSNINEDISIKYNNSTKNEGKKEMNILKSLKSNNNYEQIDTGYEYKKINDEIIKLKNEQIIFDNSIELIKNYLIINEKIIQYFFVNKKSIDKYKKYSNKIYNIFKESYFYNIDDISDNQIFNKKLIFKLLEKNLLFF